MKDTRAGDARPVPSRANVVDVTDPHPQLSDAALRVLCDIYCEFVPVCVCIECA
jgi:hypothetical protein